MNNKKRPFTKKKPCKKPKQNFLQKKIKTTCKKKKTLFARNNKTKQNKTKHKPLAKQSKPLTKKKQTPIQKTKPCKNNKTNYNFFARKI